MNLFIKFSYFSVEFFFENMKDYFLKGDEIRRNKNYDFAISDNTGNLKSTIKLKRKWFGYSKEYDGLICYENLDKEISFYLFHKPHWRSYTKLNILDDEYLVVQHKYWYLSIYKNDRQIGLIKEKTMYLGSRNSARIQLDDDVDISLICTILYIVFINKSDHDGGANFTIDLTSIVPEFRKRDENWQPNLNA